MIGNKKPNDSSEGGAGRSSSLEGLLQQAWLHSQRPKVQRRSVSDTIIDSSDEKRVCSQTTAEPQTGTDSSGAGDADGSDKTYFHKTRPEVSSEFLRRLALPQLECYSNKTDVPRSNFTSQSERRFSCAPTVSDGVSQNSASTIFSASDNLSISTSDSLSIGTQPSTTEDVFDTVDSEGPCSSSVDLAGAMAPMARFLDDILATGNLESERCPMQQTTAYQAMAKEIADLIAPDNAVEDACYPTGVDHYIFWSNSECLTTEEMHILENSSAYEAMAKEISNLLSSDPSVPETGGSEVLNDGERTGAEFAPSEETTTLKLMEGFTCMLSKHIRDVSTSSDHVDYRSWITESDEIDIHFDDAWRSYLEGCNQATTAMPGLSEFNLLLRGAGAGSTLSQERASGFPLNTSLKDLLYRCALAVSQGDAGSATDYVAELRNQSSPYGTPMQRMAHYYTDALVAKMSGTGEQLYTVITNNHPNAATMLKSYRKYVDNCPYIKLKHFFSMKSILDAFEGATRVHVIHYGILLGVEWPSLIQHLSQRPGGPPHFRLTGVHVPYPGENPLRKIHETGRRLAEFAKMWEVPFEFHALGGKWESFTAKDFDLRKDEVLAVSTCKMHNILDESVLAKSPREVLLKRIRSLNPKIFVLFVESAACNAPFFMTRFRESIKHYSLIYDGVELSMPTDAPERVILERELFGREILNIVACEGQARIERAEPYRQWQNRLQRADFIQQPLKHIVFSKIKAMMNTFHKDFGVCKDNGWVLMGIKNHIVGACSVWEPRPVMSFIT